MQLVFYAAQHQEITSRARPKVQKDKVSTPLQIYSKHQLYLTSVRSVHHVHSFIELRRFCGMGT